MRFSTFAKKREIRPSHFSTFAKNREIRPSPFSIFAEKREIHFCVYVTWTAERDKKRPLFCLRTFTFTMTGGGVIEAKRASRIVDSVSNFDDFYYGALKVFEARRASRSGVCVLDIPQVILGCRPEVWTVGLRISAHQTMCANVRLFARTMTAARADKVGS